MSELYELQPFFGDLAGLLDDYLLTGGIRKAINSYVVNATISDGIYSDYVELIIRDLSRWGAKEMLLKQVVMRLIETLSSQVSWNSLKEGTEIRTHDTIEEYVRLLRNSFVISYLYHLQQDRGTPAYAKNKKVYFNDPFIFHALRAWALGLSPFEGARDILHDEIKKSALVEAVICDHLIRFLFNLAPSAKFDFGTQLFYWVSAKQREVDFIARLKGAFLPIEAKYQEKINRSDAYGIIDFIKGGKSHKGLMLTKNTLRENREFVEVPAPLFLIIA